MKFILACVIAIGLTCFVVMFFPIINRIGFQTSFMYVNGSMLLCMIVFAYMLKVFHGK